jgi:hypothetical protein
LILVIAAASDGAGYVPRNDPKRLQVTFRVTLRWQNPKTVVSGRKYPKKLEGPKPLIPG